MFYLQPRDLQAEKILVEGKNNPNIPGGLMGDCLKAIFDSSKAYGLFTTYFDEELYHYAASFYESQVFARERPMYSVVSVMKVVEAVEISQRNYLPYQDIQRFIKQDFATIHKARQLPDKLKPYLTARLDIQLLSTEGDFQILSVSDKKAIVQKPSWLNDKSIGYMIQSYAGELRLVAKSTVDGQIYFCFRGMDIRTPEDKNKRIPYWIDYTAFTVNDKTVFDTLTPVCCDTPYIYTTEVKANEEIAIKFNWLPHRSDFIENPLPSKFLPFLTARVDISLSSTEGDFQIFSVSDRKATVDKPSWFQNNSIGYVIQSHAGQLKFTAKATIDGKINLWLRGLAINSPEDKTKRIPYWIDYTKLKINEKDIFDTLTPIWHNKFYRYIMDAKAGEELNIQVEWQPHRSDT